MSITLTLAGGAHCPKTKTVPDGLPLDELEGEMYLFACEASAWDYINAFSNGGETVTVRAWLNSAFRVSEMVERVFTVPPVVSQSELDALIAEDLERTAGR